MASKASKDKMKKSLSMDVEALVEAQKQHVIFYPVLDKSNLVKWYAHMWGRTTRAHTAPHILPGSTKSSTSKYHFFVAYFYRGLCPPFFRFLQQHRAYIWLPSA